MESNQTENQYPEMPASEQEEDYLADTKPRRVKPAQPPEGEESLVTPTEPILASETQPAPVVDVVPVVPAVPDAPAGSKPVARPVSSKKKGVAGKPGRKSRPKVDLSWMLWPIVGVAALFIIALLSAFGGYASGIEMRRDAASTLMAGQADQQFQLGLQDMEQGNYFRARQRFEYVIQLNPDYPGATEKLAEALMFLNATATPTLQPTATLTPTPDVRDQEQLFNQAQQAVLSSQWDQAIESLLALRGKDPTYRTVEIDGMLFLALRNRGKDNIVKANLESGIYDLKLASEFGPLDAEVQGLLSWSELYITGASFWDLDWEQAVNYFQQVAPQMPNLVDGSGMTASERLRVALFEYGNTLVRQGKPCKAYQVYQQSLAISPAADVTQALNQVAAGCQVDVPTPESP